MDAKLTAAEARLEARKKTEQVMYLRVLLGTAMREEAQALAVARELEDAERRAK